MQTLLYEKEENIMKHKTASLLAVFSALAMACTGGFIPLKAAAAENAGNYQLYRQDFQTTDEGEKVGVSFEAREGSIYSTDVFSQYEFSEVNYTPDWKISFDVTLPQIAEGSGFLGVNVFGLAEDVTYEFTLEETAASGAYMFIKGEGGAVVAHSGNQGNNPSYTAGTTYRVEIGKDGTVYTLKFNGEEVLSARLENTDRTATAMNLYTYNMVGVSLDNIVVEKSTLTPDLTQGDMIYTENFSSLEANEVVENNFTATDDGRILAGEGFAQYILPEISCGEDWLFSFEATFPGERDGFIGLNVLGMAASDYEFTVQKTPGTCYALIKENPSGTTFYHSNDHGTNPVLVNELTYSIAVLKVGNMFSVLVDGRTVAICEISGELAEVTAMNLYTFNLAGVKVDNLELRKVLPSSLVTSVTLSSDKQSISTMQSAQILANVLPTTAKLETVDWYISGVKAEGSNGTAFRFSSQTVGTYEIVCSVNGVESAPITVQVTEPSEEEKNSLVYENFESMGNGSKWGSFDVVDGKAVTNSAYNRYDFDYAFVRDFEISFDVVWNDTPASDSYVGIDIFGLATTANEVEFNFHNAEEDNLVVKYNGNERWYSNDTDKAGMLETLEFVTGETYTYKFVRYDDQFEFYVNDLLAIKYYISDPTVPTGMFLYTYNGEGVSLSIDNVMIKAAREITNRVEPPVVDVESAYITASSITIAEGESTSLTVQCTPFDATVTSYTWYLNDTLIEGATQKTYVFTPSEAGEYVFKCVVNGTVTSETKTVSVTVATGDKPQTINRNTGLIIGLSVAGGIIVLAAAGIIVWRIRAKRRTS